MFKFWYVTCNTDIDSYSYLSLTKKKQESFENQEEFEVDSWQEFHEAIESLTIHPYCDFYNELPNFIQLVETFALYIQDD